MKKIFLIAVFLLTAALNVSVTAVTKLTDGDLREYALNGFPLEMLFAYRGLDCIDLRTVDKQVLIMLIENTYQAHWYREGGDFDGSEKNLILTGFQQMEVMDREDAKDIMVALAKNNSLFSVATIRRLCGLPYYEWHGLERIFEVDGGKAEDFKALLKSSKEKLSYADEVLSAYLHPDELRCHVPCFITRNQDGTIIGMHRYDGSCPVTEVTTLSQRLLYEFLTGRTIDETDWDWFLLVP